MQRCYFSICTERFVLLVISDSRFVNLYLPSADSSSEIDVLLALLTEIYAAIVSAKCNFSVRNVAILIAVNL